MKSRIFQPVVFNLITIVAILFLLYQIAEAAHRTGSTEIIKMYDELVKEGDVEDAGLRVRLGAERDQRVRVGTYVLVTLIVAILANVIANYIGRGRQFENTARIRELEAEIRGLRGG